MTITVPLLSRENSLVIFGIAAGVTVSAVLAPKDDYFFSNFGFFCLSQIGALLLLLPFKPRPAAIGGAALALAIYLAAFGYWLFSRQHPESMAWLGYLFSLPGALIGGVLGSLWLTRRSDLQWFTTTALAAGFTLAGALFGQSAVCSTLMYCFGK